MSCSGKVTAQELMSDMFRGMIQNVEITTTNLCFSGSSDAVIFLPILQATFQYEALIINTFLF